MFISIDKNGKLALREPDDFKRLHIEAGDDVTREQIGRALEPIAAADGDNFWIDVAALKQLGRAGDAAWEREFRRDDQERAEVRLGEPRRTARALSSQDELTRNKEAGNRNGRGNALVG